VPYADPERQRQAERESQRRRREAQRRRDPARQTVANRAPLPAGASAGDLLEVLAELIEVVRRARGIRAPERLRAVAYGVAVALRAVEVADLSERLAALESRLRGDEPGTGSEN
jgi:hypothetical protein